ncbi:hypothetical protein D9V29_00240 [Mycetocola manganoxydans]|uniref:Uncharacterized protein n=1 Tax=Mycetocola manganoxydans TaxID=699879 RepID=A0A3L7A0M9_9MICO|nr:hypothetical protein [Mycetocola manganoxydans]RLP73769.1 hypothetical protein D9V29_00240 [Mycetocola manganoxydans]GHD43170.1 hypothetical protein GCM10008097_09860 [Mycetocola manganoxydans]
MTANKIFRAALIWGGILAVLIGVVGGFIGYTVDGTVGLTSALIGAVVGAAFLSITAGSILFANRYSESEMFVTIFFGVVLGGWLLKFVLFLVLAISLRDQPWINPLILFVSVIAAAVATLIVDAIIVMKGRVAYVAPVEPSESAESAS